MTFPLQSAFLHRLTVPLVAAVALLPVLAWPARGAQAQEVRAKHGMVVSSTGLASRVGADILKKGGNAVDAAVAVGFALEVTYPAAGNIGGGGFMLVRMADGRCVAIDYRETAPAIARRGMYLDEKGEPVADYSLYGYGASGVPGTVAGLALALEKYGTMKWADVVDPAYKLARDGIIVSDTLARSLRDSKVLRRFPESRRVYQRLNHPYEPGEVFKQPDLAETLKRIRDEGPREFYEGKTAQLIAAEMAAHHGSITRDDLKAYKPAIRAPVHGTYRGYDLLTMPPPSSGGIALIEMLNILERYDLAELGPKSPQAAHLMVEAMRRAFADRAEFPGDPDFVKIPVAGLTSKKYAAELSKQIDPNHATPSVRVKPGAPGAYESSETTHYTVVDESGNCVANTYTLNMGYGSGVTVTGAGFLMNDEMDDFAAKPGTPNGFGLIQGENNAIAAGKRPLSSMVPTIVLKGGKPLLVLGSPGGPTIINTVLETIVNVLDFGMTLRQAVDAPRFHHQWMPDLLYHEKGVPSAVIDALAAKGHTVDLKPRVQGELHAVMIDPKSGDRIGVADKRNPDSGAAGH